MAPEPTPRKPGRTVAEALDPRTGQWALLVDDGAAWIVLSTVAVERRYPTWPAARAAYALAVERVTQPGAPS